MKTAKRQILTLLLLLISGVIYAQGGHIELGARVGNNTAMGNFSAITLKGEHYFGSNFSLEGGILQSSYGRLATDVRPTYHHKVECGTLHFEGLAHYATQSSLHTFALGGGVGISFEHFFASFGYYFRTLGGASETLTEPFNLYYKFGVNCLPEVEDWDLLVTFSNSHLLDLDRHYQPSLAAEGMWHLSDRLGATLGICYKPTGIFHISTVYYQFYTNFGVCYKW